MLIEDKYIKYIFNNYGLLNWGNVKMMALGVFQTEKRCLMLNDKIILLYMGK